MSRSGTLGQVPPSPASGHPAAAGGVEPFVVRVLQACPDLICVWDIRAQRILYCNAAAEPMLGVTPEQMQSETGDTLRRLLGEPQRIALASAIDQLADLPDGSSLRLRLPVRAADGNRRWLAARLSPFDRNATGALTQCLL